MPPVFRLWISPYGDDDFEWNRSKKLSSASIPLPDRDFVFEAALRIVFRAARSCGARTRGDGV